MNLGIEGKTALVLAGAGGLGRAIALSLAEEGANIALADADETALAAVLPAIGTAGTKLMALPWRLGDLSVVDANIERIEREIGSVDIVVNITGGPPPTPAIDQEPGLWRRHFDAMVLSIIAVADRVLPAMRQRKWGRIITSTSSGVIAPIPNLAISNALRLALVGWSKSLAREIAAEGITANIVVPGRISTGRIRFLDEEKARREGKTVAEIMAASTSAIPMARYGDPDEYAAVVTFLASQLASYVTGTVIRVDGGLVASI